MRAPLRLGALAALLALAAGCTPPTADKNLPVRVRLSCGEVYEMLQNMPFDTLHETSGPVTDPHTAAQRPGCHIVGRGSRKALSELERTSATRPDARMRELMPSRGWREDPRYAAGRPSGTDFAYTLGGVICYVAARWDAPGAATDPNALVDAAALPPDTYEVSVSCAEPAP